MSQASAVISTQKVTAALAEMTPDTKRIYEKFMQIERDGEVQLAVRRYNQGRLVAKKIEQAERGEGMEAMHQLVDATGMSLRSLYMFRNLAQAWTVPEFKKLIKQRMPGGRTISVSHLLLIGNVDGAKKLRDQLVKHCLAEPTTIDDLEALIQKKLGVSRRGNKSSRRVTAKTPAAALRLYCRDLMESVELSEQTRSLVFERLSEDASKFATEEVARSLDELLAEVGKLMSLLPAIEQDARTALDAIGRTLTAESDDAMEDAAEVRSNGKAAKSSGKKKKRVMRPPSRAAGESPAEELVEDDAVSADEALADEEEVAAE